MHVLVLLLVRLFLPAGACQSDVASRSGSLPLCIHVPQQGWPNDGLCLARGLGLSGRGWRLSDRCNDASPWMRTQGKPHQRSDSPNWGADCRGSNRPLLPEKEHHRGVSRLCTSLWKTARRVPMWIVALSEAQRRTLFFPQTAAAQRRVSRLDCKDRCSLSVTYR